MSPESRVSRCDLRDSRSVVMATTPDRRIFGGLSLLDPLIIGLTFVRTWAPGAVTSASGHLTAIAYASFFFFFGVSLTYQVCRFFTRITGRG